MEKISSPIQTAARLSRELLEEVAEGRNLIGHVPGFVSQTNADYVQKSIAQAENHSSYDIEPRLHYQGQALANTKTPDKRERYFQRASDFMEQRLCMFGEVRCPMEFLRASLDNLWEGGAKLALFDGRKAFAGIYRSFSGGVGAFPHQDDLCRDPLDGHVAQGTTCQLTFNIYLSMPSQGGDVLVYDYAPEEDEAETLKIRGHSYGLDKDLFSNRGVARIKPQVGDLLLWDSRNVHSVEASESGLRATLSLFALVFGRGQALQLFS